MIVLGLDPGTTNPGLALLRLNARGWSVLRLPAINTQEKLWEELGVIIKLPPSQRPQIIGFESVAWTLHVGADRENKVKHGHGSGRILESVGALRLVAATMGVSPTEVHPNTWRRRIAGYHRASKEQVREILQRTVKDWPTRAVSTNRSDAAAVAITAASMHGFRTK